MTRYITKDGDMVDLICKRHYGSINGYVEEVLNYNPGLADIGAILPSGLVIKLPEIPQIKIRENTIRLWS